MARAFLFCCLLIVSEQPLFAQYFYGGGQQIRLHAIDGEFVVQLEADSVERADAIFQLAQQGYVISYPLGDDRGFFLVKARVGGTLRGAAAEQRIASTSGVVRVAPAYAVGPPPDDPSVPPLTRFIFTDVIRVRFHENASQADIEALNATFHVEVLDAWEETLESPQNRITYRVYTIRVTESSVRSTLEVANLYYTSQLTIWASPNAVADIAFESTNE